MHRQYSVKIRRPPSVDKTFYKNKFKKVILYTSTAIIFAASPALSVCAAETNAQQETISIPAEIPNNTTSGTDAPPTQTTPLPQTPADTTVPTPQTPADTIPVTPQAPTDAATVTPLPEPAPADQDTFDITPMQSTVYAASAKGLNVRSGPSTNHSKLGTLKYGQEITVTGKTADNWYQIQYSGGIGYVLADFVSTTPPANTQNPVPETPAPETPDTNTGEIPPDESPDDVLSSDLQSEDTPSEGGNTAVISRLVETPVVVGIVVAIIGVIALIAYSVYSLFKKDTNATDEDEYYEDDDPYSDEYDDEDELLYPDDEYYEDNEPYPDDEDDADNEYDTEQYSDAEYDEDDIQYSDDEYYENDIPYSDDEDDDTQR